jgi:hypothetical protein
MTATEFLQRFDVTAGLAEQVAEIAVVRGMVDVQLQGLAVLGLGLARLAQGAQGVAEVPVRVSVAGIQVQCCAEFDLGLRWLVLVE